MISSNFPSFLKSSKVRLVALLLCVTFNGLVAQTAPSSEPIPKSRQVILSSSVYNRPTWTPSEEQTDLALVAIYEYLDASLEEPMASVRFSNAMKVKYIKEHMDEFAVQFQGVGYGDRRVIWCNFFPVEEHPDWKVDTVHGPRESEALYWNIVFNPDENACREFSYTWVKL
ncbi:hypothetical protein [Cerasicoccus fimbriatus]|uniref:hypothetical protein n=1 Tax=Cerasicoccus fimbriatus TaxID=3014554 RepID=UPI0022B4FB5A|nr:hypothetical protein [Cerasicoccus sp. TK19100]